ncbi:GK22245, related [Neospora caninum Liverpool]|uniref:GK22245, related n=1 Tax=Neospora caninum (strain Liverpool) TaxID=572307 RepID=F0VPZ6_NEOCL|nr:GK22245, related [Neospora caninum Liverpool]CBZ55793.1 GK22245, related [Neospora caninum Liverpool]CEL70536.1 TPA: GK22245, related [Neospora caninum Liverpool]|eukprot:XP_003885819.1 GK22245, related [Neospora caninum Liverpool]
MAATPAGTLVRLYSILVSASCKNAEGQCNFAFSPYSVSTALAVLYFGARGTSQEQLQSLYFDGRSPNDAANCLKEAITVSEKEEATDLGRQSPVSLQSANRLYASKELVGASLPQFRDFREIIEKQLRTEALLADFQAHSRGEREKINAWVSDVTNRKITDILPPSAVTSETILLLVSTLYFKGPWLKPFVPCERNGPSKFYRQGPSGATIFQDGIKFMESTQVCSDKFCYGFKHTDRPGFGVTLLEVPYKDSDYSMAFFMPDNPSDLVELEQMWQEQPDLLSDLVQEMADASHAELQDVELTIRLPYFKVGGKTIALLSALETLGVTHVFGPNANLSGINGGKGLFLSNVFHQCVVEIDEVGTEAAAAAAAGVACTSLPLIREQRVIDIDRSFLFQIRKLRHTKDLKAGKLPVVRRDDDIFFVGRVVDMSALQSDGE